jgi:nicotinamidase-related amidase
MVSRADRYVLVVVDMQPFFTTHEQTIANVLREVVAARQSGMPIVFLEITHHRPEPHVPYGPTHERLLQAVQGYESWQISGRVGTGRKGMDGSTGLLEACRRNGYPVQKFRVCGVQTDLCVLATVKGLLRRRSGCEVQVVWDACHCDPAFQLFCRARYPEGKRLRIV